MGAEGFLPYAGAIVSTGGAFLSGLKVGESLAQKRQTIVEMRGRIWVISQELNDSSIPQSDEKLFSHWDRLGGYLWRAARAGFGKKVSLGEVKVSIRKGGKLEVDLPAADLSTDPTLEPQLLFLRNPDTDGPEFSRIGFGNHYSDQLFPPTRADEPQRDIFKKMAAVVASRAGLPRAA